MGSKMMGAAPDRRVSCWSRCREGRVFEHAADVEHDDQGHGPQPADLDGQGTYTDAADGQAGICIAQPGHPPSWTGHDECCHGCGGDGASDDHRGHDADARRRV
eukprot:3846806-Rhodomonas_salina.1